MKQSKRVIFAMLLLCALTIQCLFVTDAKASTVDSTEKYHIMFVDSNKKNNVQLAANSDQCTINQLNQNTDLEDYDMYVVNDADLPSIAPQTAESIVESGAVLCVLTGAPNEALSAIYEQLGEKYDLTLFASGATILGVYVVNRDGELVPGLLCSQMLVSGSSSIANADSDVACDTDASVCCENYDFSGFLDWVFSKHSLSEYSDKTTLRSMPSGPFYRTFEGYTEFIYNGAKKGGAGITEYVIAICTFEDGGVRYRVDDVLANIFVDAEPGYYVSSYKTRMHCNFPGDFIRCIDETYLNSNSSSSTSLSTQYGSNSAGLISGNWGRTTTYSYNTNNQTITNDYPSATIRNWNSIPTVAWKDASWVLEPGIRVINSGCKYQSAVCTSTQEVKITGTFLTYPFSPFEIGGNW